MSNREKRNVAQPTNYKVFNDTGREDSSGIDEPHNEGHQDHQRHDNEHEHDHDQDLEHEQMGENTSTSLLQGYIQHAGQSNMGKMEDGTGATQDGVDLHVNSDYDDLGNEAEVMEVKSTARRTRKGRCVKTKSLPPPSDEFTFRTLPLVDDDLFISETNKVDAEHRHAQELLIQAEREEQLIQKRLATEEIK